VVRRGATWRDSEFPHESVRLKSLEFRVLVLVTYTQNPSLSIQREAARLLSREESKNSYAARGGEGVGAGGGRPADDDEEHNLGHIMDSLKDSEATDEVDMPFDTLMRHQRRVRA